MKNAGADSWGLGFLPTPWCHQMEHRRFLPLLLAEGLVLNQPFPIGRQEELYHLRVELGAALPVDRQQLSESI